MLISTGKIVNVLFVSIMMFGICFVSASSTKSQDRGILLKQNDMACKDEKSINILISLEKNVLFSQENNIASIEIQNTSKHETYLKRIPGISFTISKHKRNELQYYGGISEYYGASMSIEDIILNNQIQENRVIKSGESVSFRINLSNLVWEDMVSSVKKDKKLSEAIYNGDYFLFAESQVGLCFKENGVSVNSVFSNEVFIKLLQKSQEGNN